MDNDATGLEEMFDALYDDGCAAYQQAEDEAMHNE